MKYNITLADTEKDHFYSQSNNRRILAKSGFTNVKWKMGTRRKNGDTLHQWVCNGDSDSLLVLKLSADVEKIEEIS